MKLGKIVNELQERKQDAKISQEARIMSWACQADIQGREIESPAIGS